MFRRGNSRASGTGEGSSQGRGQSRGQSRSQGAGRGPGRKGPFAAGPGGDCICPSCGHREKHSAGTPCTSRKCPECGAGMTRAGV